VTHGDQDTEHCTRHLGSVVERRERVSNESEKGSGGQCGEVGKEQEGKV
jgi:hypothetical protein